jgi:hypothetical protein
MRKKVLWRYTPSVQQEEYIRQQAKAEGRELSGMIHKLVDEAILQRQVSASRTNRLIGILRGDVESAHES